MSNTTIHQCECPECQKAGASLEKALHHQINLVLSRLDEQQKRWYAAVEANRYSEKGVPWVSQITGLDEKTIRRGQAELAEDLVNRPKDRVRLAGAGRQKVEKKTRKSSKT
jgi:hypothetical protein